MKGKTYNVPAIVQLAEAGERTEKQLRSDIALLRGIGKRAEAERLHRLLLEWHKRTAHSEDDNLSESFLTDLWQWLEEMEVQSANVGDKPDRGIRTTLRNYGWQRFIEKAIYTPNPSPYFNKKGNSIEAIVMRHANEVSEAALRKARLRLTGFTMTLAEAWEMLGALPDSTIPFAWNEGEIGIFALWSHLMKQDRNGRFNYNGTLKRGAVGSRILRDLFQQVMEIGGVAEANKVRVIEMEPIMRGIEKPRVWGARALPGWWRITALSDEGSELRYSLVEATKMIDRTSEAGAFSII